MRCRDCGYILDGLPGRIFPECGAEFDPDDPQTFVIARRPISFRRLAAWLTAAVWMLAHAGAATAAV